MLLVILWWQKPGSDYQQPSSDYQNHQLGHTQQGHQLGHTQQGSCRLFWGAVPPKKMATPSKKTKSSQKKKSRKFESYR